MHVDRRFPGSGLSSEDGPAPPTWDGRSQPGTKLSRAHPHFLGRGTGRRGNRWPPHRTVSRPGGGQDQGIRALLRARCRRPQPTRAAKHHFEHGETLHRAHGAALPRRSRQVPSARRGGSPSRAAVVGFDSRNRRGPNRPSDSRPNGQPHGSDPEEAPGGAFAQGISSCGRGLLRLQGKRRTKQEARPPEG